jgi:hypothetical protein
MSTPNATLQFASDLLSKIKANSLRAEDLTTEQRRICVRFIVHQKEMTKTEMSEVLKVARQTIYDDIEAIQKGDVGASLMVNEIEIVRELIQTAEIACARLMRKGKEKDSFSVWNSLVERLQSLGYVKMVPKKMQLSGSVSLLEVLAFEQSLSDDQPNGNGSAGNGHNGNGRDHKDGSRLTGPTS